MTDQPGREPEQRLPAPRTPAEPAPAERFSAAPSAHRLSLTPERAAQIVRQSGSARLIGFLAVLVVVLFVILYYFYELGFPGGLSQSRLQSETDAQQVTSIERGYNLFQANCARCHGVNGEGGIGPVLNDQMKLFVHLNPQYLKNVLTVGGRYVCGNATSLMPVWSQDNGGPLNYKQIEDLINFIRAPKGPEYTVRDPSLFEPIRGPDGKIETFTGWRDPNFKPAPGATPFPACWADAFKSQGGGASPAPSAPASAAPSAGQAGAAVTITASGIAFTTASVEAPANTAFTLTFDNQDAGVPHNVDIKDASGASVFKTDIFNGAAKKDFTVPALPAGTYQFVCDVHPNMTGTLTVK